MGPLDQTFELPDRCSVRDLVDAVAGSRFLQFSSTHTTLISRISGKEVATVFSPYMEPRRDTVFAVPPETVVRSIAVDNTVDFGFERG
jgi:hypothetical protein